MRGAVVLVLLAVAFCRGCSQGRAYPGAVLSVPRSLVANADVAHLRTYDSPALEKCLRDCCTGVYGACSVASFRQNTTEKNCFHFYCQPLSKCQFLPAPSIDSFSFSSDKLVALHKVPLSIEKTVADNANQTFGDRSSFRNLSSTDESLTIETNTSSSLPSPTTTLLYDSKEEITHFSEEQFAAKDDNVTVKPRKGVDELIPKTAIDKSVVKPRKGVSFKDVLSDLHSSNRNTLNVKPRKGVEFETSILIVPTETHSFIEPSAPIEKNKTLRNENMSSDDLMSALALVFGDDLEQNTALPTNTITPYLSFEITRTKVPSYENNSTFLFKSTSSTSISKSTQKQSISISKTTNLTPPVSFSSIEIATSFTTTSSVAYTFTQAVQNTSNHIYHISHKLINEAISEPSISEKLPHIVKVRPSNQPGIAAEDNHSSSEIESESNRKYTTSVHLILSLIFGLLVLVVVLGVVAKRFYDGWQRRDYYKMNYLIDGIYNSYE